MPAIQAMRSDAMAMRSKEDVQEKIPSFYNQVNQALGSSIVQGQDAAEQLLEQRFQAANQLAAQIRQKIDGQGAIAELSAGAGLKMISSALSITLALLSKTTTTDLLELGSALINFSFELTTLKLQWEAAAATYAQWTVQAGFTGHGSFFAATAPTGSGTNPTQPPVGSPVANQDFQAQQFLRISGTATHPTNTATTAQVQTMLDSRTYATPATQPTNLVPYEIRELSIPFTSDLVDPGQPYDPVTNPYIPATYDPVTNPYVTRNAFVSMDATTGGANNSSATNPAGTIDDLAQVFIDPGTGALYLSYLVKWTQSGATGGTTAVPSVTGTINTTTYTIDYPNTTPDYTGSASFSNPSQAAPVAGAQTFPFYLPPVGGVMNRAMGARGALRYRDALTPRYTDRKNYRASAMDYRDYEAWYAWGSVGSISRVGQY